MSPLGSLDFTFAGAGGFAAAVATGFGFGVGVACLAGVPPVDAVVSDPPNPILRARLEKKPSEFEDGAAATRTGELADGFAGSARAEAAAAAGDAGADPETYSPPVLDGEAAKATGVSGEAGGLTVGGTAGTLE